MKKFPKQYFYYRLLADVFIVLFFVMALFGGVLFDEETGIVNTTKAIIILVVLYVISYIVKAVFSFLFVKVSGYELTDTEIKCKRGVLFKKNSVVQYSKVHAVNKKQNLFHKIFHIALLKVDSGSTNTAYTSEIVIIEKEDVINALLSEIKARQNGTFTNKSDVVSAIDKGENLYSFSAKGKVVYSLINAVLTISIVLVCAFVFLLIYAGLLPYLLTVKVQSALSALLNAFMIIGMAFVGISVLTFIISVITMFLSYYGFEVYKYGDNLEINYGFFVKNNNAFKLNRVKGVIIEQGIIKKLFGYATVKLEVIGYNHSGSNNSESDSGGLLMPLVKMSEVKEKLNKILPSYIPLEKQETPKKLMPYVLWPLFFTLAFTILPILIVVLNLIIFKISARIILTVLAISFIIMALETAFVFMLGYLQFKNSGIGKNENTITLYTGAFVKRISVIKQQNLIAIEDVTTPLRKKAGIYSVLVHFSTNYLTNVIAVKNLSKELAEELKNYVKY